MGAGVIGADGRQWLVRAWIVPERHTGHGLTLSLTMSFQIVAYTGYLYSTVASLHAYQLEPRQPISTTTARRTVSPFVPGITVPASSKPPAGNLPRCVTPVKALTE